MTKRIAVLGHNMAMEEMMSYIDDSIVDKFLLIKSLTDCFGVEFSEVILLDGWNSAYRNSKDILMAVKIRIR